MHESAACEECGREVRDDHQKHDGCSPCLIHVNTGLHACQPDSDRLASYRALSDESRRG